MKRSVLCIFPCILVAASLGMPGAYAQIWRVDKDTPLAGQPLAQDGTSWDRAFETIQQGIDAAYLAGGGEVWVAEGVYGENRAEDWGDATITGSLVLKDGVEVYGGFKGYQAQAWLGNETARVQRTITSNITVVDGLTARNGNRAYHVVVVGKEFEATTGARLDGFHVRNGGTTGLSSGNYYHTWRGGGLYNYGSNPVIANCTFYDNTAPVSGGAIANEINPNTGDPGNATIINCVFYNNSAARLEETTANPIRGGGAIYNNQSSATIIHCTFYNNSVGNPGYTAFGANSGGIYNWTASPVVTHSIFWLNAIVNEGVRNFPADVPWDGGASVSYSDIQGGYTCPAYVANGPDPGAGAGFWACGTSNINANPNFSETGPRFPLTAGSPCENTGNATPLPGAATDIQGLARPLGLAIDRGAYEGNGVLAPPAADINDSVLQSLQNYVPETYNFDNLASTGSLPVRYYWDIDGDADEDYGIKNPPHTYSTQGTYTVTLWVSNGLGNATDSITITLRNPVSIGAPSPLNPPQQDTYQPITFTVGTTVAGGFAPPYHYQWQYSPDNVTWGLTFPNGNTLSDGTKTAVVPGRNPAIDPISDPVGAYQVSVQYSITGSQSPTLTIDHALDHGLAGVTIHDGYYRCVVSDDLYPTTPIAQGITNSVSTQLQIRDRVEILRQPQGGQYYEDNDESVDVVVFGGSNPQDYVYQWRIGPIGINDTNVNPYSFIADADPPQPPGGPYNPGTGSPGNYNVIVNDPSTVTARSSQNGLVEVQPAVTITTPPTNEKWNVTEDVTFSVVATGGYPAVGGYTYEWQWEGQPLTDGTGTHPSGSNCTISGATTDTLLIEDLEESDEGAYTVIVGDSKSGDDPPCPEHVGKCTDQATATLTVTNNIVIIDDPDNQDVYVGDDAVFSVTPTAGEPASYAYEWYWDFGEGGVQILDGPHPSGTGSTISGATTATLTLSNVSFGSGPLSDEGLYYAIVRDAVPENEAGTSNTAALGIYNPVLVTDDPDPVNAYENGTAVFSVVATGGLRDELSLQWEVDAGSGFGPISNGGGVSGATTAMLTLSPPALADDGNRYRCVVTAPASDDPSSPASNATDTSDDALLRVSTELVLLDEPADVQAYKSDPAFILRTHFEGGMQPYSTDWRREGIDPASPETSVGSGAVILGSPNTALLSVNPAAVNVGTYDYAVEISDQVTTKRSGTGAVEIANALSFVRGISNTVVRERQEFVWEVEVDGGLGTVEAQWYKDDGTKAFVPVPEDSLHEGTQTFRLTFNEVAFSDAGVYRVEVSDDFMSIYSQAELVVQNALPAAGALGLALLAGASALGGALALRRRERK